MKNKKLNLIILFIAIGLVLYFSLKDDFSGVIKELSKVNILIFLFSILILLLSLLFKSLSLKTFINEYEKKYKIKNAYQLTLIGQLLNGITPFQSGGQPFQIYLLKKDGIRISDSTNAMIKDFIAFQTALILVGIFAFLINIKLNVFSKNQYLNSLIFLGFLINFIVMIILLLISSAKKTGLKLSNKFIDFLFRFKVMKKFGTTKENIKKSLNHFYKTSGELKDQKKIIIKSIIYNIIHLILLYTIPFIIFKSLGLNGITVLESIVSVAFVMLIGNFIPIPGATGGIEYSFLQFFGIFTTGAILTGGMLLWRFVTYFLAMIIGFVALVFRKRRIKK